MSRPLHSQHPPRTCRACCFSYPFRRRRRFSPAGSAADPAAADQQAARCRPTHALGNPEAIASRFCRRDHGRGTRLCRRRSRLMGSARVVLVAWILAFRRGEATSWRLVFLGAPYKNGTREAKTSSSPYLITDPASPSNAKSIDNWATHPRVAPSTARPSPGRRGTIHGACVCARITISLDWGAS